MQLRLVTNAESHDNPSNESPYQETMPEQKLHPIEASPLHAKRERVFLILAGLFLGSLTMLNILGVSRFIALCNVAFDENGSWIFEWGKMGGDVAFALAVGVLPYPITFLCTDLISEFYGRKRANWVVLVGLMLNIWVVLILWLGGILPQQPKFDEDGLPEISIVAKDIQQKEEEEEFDLGIEIPDEFSDTTSAEEELEEVRKNFKVDVPGEYAFFKIRQLAFAAVLASMIAYLAAQFTDVYLFHFWKRLTKGKHLWLRNNGSTLISQLVDTVAVMLITHFAANGLGIAPDLPMGEVWRILFFTFILPGYVFKVVAALLDTIPFYWAVGFLKKQLEFDPINE